MYEQKKQQELEMAKNIKDQFPDMIALPESGEFFVKNNGVYKKISDNSIEDWITMEFIDNNVHYTPSKGNTVRKLLKGLCHKSKTELENYDQFITLENGVYFFNKTIKQLKVNNDTKESWTVDTHFNYFPVYDIYSFTKIPVHYDPNATCPLIDKFIEEVFGKDKVEDVYNFIGYLLLPHIKYQRAMILLGSGSNGKSTFLDLLIEFLGVDNTVQVPLQELNNEFSIINLRHKMANIVADLSAREIRETGYAKRVVTDEYLSGSIKYIQGKFNFKNQCKMLYSCNVLPPTKDKSDAFFRRWCLFICSATFKGDNIDFNIKEKLTSKEELSGLFNRAIEGIERLKANNGFPDTTKEVASIWKLESNPVSDFIIEETFKKKGALIKSTELYSAINKYNTERGREALDGRQLGYWIRQLGYYGSQRRDLEAIEGENAKWYTYYEGLALNSKKEKDQRRLM